MLQVEDLHYTYCKDTPFAVKALSGINLNIKRGEFIGIIGQTGSGKSTLIQHFNGLLLPTKGRVLLEGVDLARLKGQERRYIRKKVGLVFQYPEYQLFGETVFEDIAFGPRNFYMSEKEITKCVEEALDMVGLSFKQFSSRSPFSLSGGEKRRVALAGILAMKPQMLVLDEPTAGLDIEGKERITSLLKEFHSRGVTIVMVTHNMEDVALLADRIIVLAGGSILLEGTKEEVFSKPSLLEELGLELPQIPRVLYLLKKNNFFVQTSLFSVEEAKEEILNCLNRRGDKFVK